MQFHLNFLIYRDLYELLTTPHDHMVPDSDDFAWAPF